METANPVVHCGRKEPDAALPRAGTQGVGIAATMLTKCLLELDADALVYRPLYPTIPVHGGILIDQAKWGADPGAGVCLSVSRRADER